MACRGEVNHVVFACPKLGRNVSIALIYRSQCGSRFGDKPVLVGFDCGGAEECGVKAENQAPMWSRCVYPLCPHR